MCPIFSFLRKKVAFFTDLTQKIGVFGCKFYSHKNCVSVKKMTILRYAYQFPDDLFLKHPCGAGT